MSNPITVTLKNPITLPTNEVLSTVTLARATAGQVALARAAVAKNPGFGPALMDDTLSLALHLLPYLAISSNVSKLPPQWPMQASEDDAETLVTAYGALRGGFSSVEAFLADVASKQAAAQQAAERGEAPPIHKEEAFPAGESTPEAG